jgi:hypothetical protein
MGLGTIETTLIAEAVGEIVAVPGTGVTGVLVEVRLGVYVKVRVRVPVTVGVVVGV